MVLKNAFPPLSAHLIIRINQCFIQNYSNINTSFFTSVDEMISSLIWNKRSPRIKKTYLQPIWKWRDQTGTHRPVLGTNGMKLFLVCSFVFPSAAHYNMGKTTQPQPQFSYYCSYICCMSVYPPIKKQ